MFLACIAKGLTLQVKSKGRDKESHKTPVSTLTSATIFNDRHAQDQKLGSRWWMRGTMPRRVAESIIQLVRDMASVCTVDHAVDYNVQLFIFNLNAPNYCLGCSVRDVVGSDEG